MKSYNDPEKDAIGVCVRCGKAIGSDEAVTIGGKLYCKECAGKIGGQKRLYRLRKDRILGGVCSGLAEYIGIDPTIVRVLWVIISFVYGFGILIYIVLALIVPKEPLINRYI